MLIEARVTSIWKKQKLLVVAIFLGAGAWFLLDATVGYPRANSRYSAWKRFHDAGQEAEWVQYAAEHGWAQDEWTKFMKKHEWATPHPDARTREDIIGQYVIGSIGLIAGTTILLYFLGQQGRVLRLDEEALTTSAGVRVPFGAITGLGLKKWESKGFATVLYKIDGKAGSYVIDDYKFDTQPARQILDEIKARVEARQSAETAGADATDAASDSPKPGGEGIA